MLIRVTEIKPEPPVTPVTPVGIAEHGQAFFADYVSRMFDLARWFAREIDAAPDFELATQPQANIVCFRVTRPGIDDLDALQVRIREELVHWARSTWSRPVCGTGPICGRQSSIPERPQTTCRPS